MKQEAEGTREEVPPQTRPSGREGIPAVHGGEHVKSTTEDLRSEHRPGSAGEHLLQCAYGSEDRADRFYRDQVLDHLNDAMREFVGRMELAFVATADACGSADCSLRSGPPGFIQVLDRDRIAYPEYRGNGVHASLGNLVENPGIGILLIDFVRDTIGLHINGSAEIVRHEDILADHPQIPMDHERGRSPQRWVVVHVEEAYVHCRKHIPRMQPAPSKRAWGSDDAKVKGGDYFGVRADRRAAQSNVNGS